MNNHEILEYSEKFKNEIVSNIKEGDEVYLAEISAPSDAESDDANEYLQLVYIKKQVNSSDVAILSKEISELKTNLNNVGLRNIEDPHHALFINKGKNISVIFFSKTELDGNGFKHKFHPQIYPKILSIFEKLASNYGFTMDKDPDYWANKYKENKHLKEYQYDSSR